jgi:serine/threonine protein kinase
MPKCPNPTLVFSGSKFIDTSLSQSGIMSITPGIKPHVDVEPNQGFQLVKHLEEGVWLAKRVTDGEELLARLVGGFELLEGDDATQAYKLTQEQRHDLEAKRLLHCTGQLRVLANLLNHENLISIAGCHQQSVFENKIEKKDYFLLWDYCNAGTLQQLFADKSIVFSKGRYMPESFCWHVLTSILRALVWLHHGIRWHRDLVKDHTWLARVDEDWLPILHRNVYGSTIFFQQAKGAETYGACKLGNFEKAFVSGHRPVDINISAAGDNQGGRPSQPTILAPRQGWDSFQRMRTQWQKYLDSKDPVGETPHHAYPGDF